jgi:glycosyltransferase involved in cell wall biosynthesis
VAQPAFTIVIPVRDDADGLPRALASVLAQNFASFEVIVVDDGSTKPVAREEDPRVHVVRHERSRGPGAARNTGMSRASGEYVAFLDSDDVFRPNRLEHAYRVHAEGAELVVCGGARAGESSAPRPRPWHTTRRRPAEFLNGLTPHLGRVSIRRTAAHTFDDRYLACQDIEWWCRVPETLTVVEHYSPDHMFWGTDHPRILNSPSARLAFSYLLLDQHPEIYMPGSRARAFRLLRIADFEARCGSSVLSRAAAYEALRCHPDWGALKYVIRLSVRRSARVKVRVGDEPLPPIPRRRASRFRPFAIGGAEGALRYHSRAKRMHAAAHPFLPKPVRRAVRVFLRRHHAMTADSVFGKIPMLPATVVDIAPVVREPLETEVFARLIQPGATVIDVGANDGWFSLIGAARAGRTGRVVAYESDPRSAASVRKLIALIPDHPAPIELIEAAVESREVTPWWHLIVSASSAVIRLDVQGLESDVLHTLLRARPAAADLPTLMFGMESTRYARVGSSRNELKQFLEQAGYDLFLIDYTAGGLERFRSPAQLIAPCRNVVAVPREEMPTVLDRVHGPDGVPGRRRWS